MQEQRGARAVALRRVTHRYDADPVLRDVELAIAPGEAMALLGPSGCGKTTLLRIIAGLERPASGAVEIGGETVADSTSFVPPERRSVGMVFQDWALFPHFTVAANVGYGLPRRERSGSAVTEALDLVGLADYADRMPATLSGGQQQRVALARALAPRPGVLLLDEPFSSLDTTRRIEVRTEVHRLLAELSITTVFVTHDQEEAFVVGDRVAVMREGEVVQVGTPPELYESPADRWVAEFVGSVSHLPATARAGMAETPLGAIPLRAQLDGAVDVMLRPEQLGLADGDDGVVDLIEFYGHDSMVFVTIGDLMLRVRCGPMERWRRGDRVSVRFTGERATAFAHPEQAETIQVEYS